MSNRRSIVLIGLLVLILAVIATLSRRSTRPSPPARRRAAAVGIAAVGGVWMLVNQRVEGPILIVLAPSRGLTVADLPSVALFVIALSLAIRSRCG